MLLFHLLEVGLLLAANSDKGLCWPLHGCLLHSFIWVLTPWHWYFLWLLPTHFRVRFV